VRFTVYIFGYKILVIDITETTESAPDDPLPDKRKPFDRIIKSGSRYCMNAMTR
jgi:hypothetical protein